MGSRSRLRLSALSKCSVFQSFCSVFVADCSACATSDSVAVKLSAYTTFGSATLRMQKHELVHRSSALWLVLPCMAGCDCVSISLPYTAIGWHVKRAYMSA